MEDLPVGVEALRRQAFDLSQLTNRVGAVENAIRGRLIPPRGVQGQSVGFDSGGLPTLTDYLSSSWATIPYATAWSDFGAGYGPPQYAKTRDGVVAVRGLVKKAGGSGSGTICTLPSGFRPPINLVFAAYLSDGAAEYPCSLYALSTGDVLVSSYMTPAANLGVVAATTVSWLTLSVIRFETA